MKRIILAKIFFLALLLLGLSAQIDPRIASIINNVSPQQMQMMANNLGMMNQGQNPLVGSATATNLLNLESTPEEPETSSPEELDELDYTDDVLKKLIFLEKLLLKDLETLEKKEVIDAEEKLSANDKLRRIESLEQTKSIIFEIKQKQRDEIEKQSREVSRQITNPLKPFGHDFFLKNKKRKHIDARMVSLNYEVGPGDVLEVLLFGQRNDAFYLPINRDGIIHFPNIGPINIFAQGRDFVTLKNVINQRIKQHLGEGVQSSISLGALRSFQIFVLGQVDSPGSYLVSPHSSITDALRIAGGVNLKGSLRKISLNREGEGNKTLDFYDLLLKGDSSMDVNLEDGDVVFVPVVGPQVSLDGEVHLPAIYELLGSTKLVDLLTQIGGVTENAFTEYISLKRRNSLGRFDLKTFNLDAPESLELKGGDIVTVASIEDRFVHAVEVFGPVERPGSYQWKRGMNLQSLFSEFGSFLENADLRFGYIVRENDYRELSIIHFYPRDVIKGIQEIELFEDDRVYVLSTESLSERMRDIRRLLLELKKHTPQGLQAKIASINGEVHFPGEYPLSEEMTVHDLILAGGGLTDASYVVGAELTRIGLDEDSFASVKHLRIKSQALQDGNGSESFLLKPYDALSIKPIPSWQEAEAIEITGEVNFPGKYVIRPGETLSEVITRAGGLTKFAFAQGAYFTRKSLAAKEVEQRERLIARLEADLAEASLQALDSQEAQRSETAADAMLKRLQNMDSVGRLVIDLSAILEKMSSDFSVKNGDTLHIPELPSSVSVAGEVQFPTAHLHDDNLDLDDYLNRSGGFTRNADQKRIFVVKSNGVVQSISGNKWFEPLNGSQNQIEAGDVIVVPIDVKQSRWLEKLSYTSQIIYQMAITAAAVNSFN